MRASRMAAWRLGLFVCAALLLPLSSGASAAADLTARQLCQVGDAYRAADRSGDALAAYRQALMTDPEEPCGRRGVDATGDIPASWRAQVVGVVRRPLIPLLVVLALLYGVLRLAWRPLSRIPVLGRHFAPRLELATLDQQSAGEGNPGAPLAARIVERMLAFRGEAQSADVLAYSLDLSIDDQPYIDVFADNAALDNALAKAADVSERAKLAVALFALLNALVPRPRVKVEGALGPPDGVASATFSLMTGSRLSAAATLSVTAAGRKVTATDYVRIADVAAAWVQFETGRWLGRRETCRTAGESFAALRDGIDWHLDGARRQAREAFLRAIQLDPRNWAARVNLALSEARLGADYRFAIGTLRAAFRDHVEAESRESDGPSPWEGPDAYRIVYQLAAQHVNAALCDPAGRDAQLDEADRVVAELLDKTAMYLGLHPHRSTIFRGTTPRAARRRERAESLGRLVLSRRAEQRREQTKRMKRFLLESVIPCTMLVRASILVIREAKADAGESPAVARIRRRGDELSDRYHYALACYEARCAEAAAAEASAAAAVGDASAEAAATTTSNQSIERAFEALQCALARADRERRVAMGRWARRDPSLRGLGNSAGRHARLDSILSAYAIPGDRALRGA